ncbi:MAG TPA: EAL domain-containing protein [Methylotenera sp.]|nr:EAL domain-containing protein [Methylotenera sp.]
MKRDKTEQARLEELQSYCILNSSPEADFDNITQLVAHICEVPVATISFIDNGREWFKSSFGLEGENHHEIAFGAKTIRSSDILITPDTLLDLDFASNPMVAGRPHIRFYAGVPLISPNGMAIGVLAVKDYQPRKLNDFQINTLKTMADQVMVQLEARRQKVNLDQVTLERDQINRRLTLQTDRLEKEREFLRALLENLQEGIVACDENGKLSLFNNSTREIHGLYEKRLPPEQWADHYNLYLADGKTPMSVSQIPLFRAFEGEKVVDEELVIVPKDHPARIVKCNGQAILTVDGKKLGAVVAMRDVTEQKAKEVALAKSEAKLAAIFNQSYLFQGLMEADGTVIDINDLALNACGYQRDAEVGKKFWNTSWWNNDPQVSKYIKDIVQKGLNGEIIHASSDYFIANGERRQTEFVLSPIRDNSGVVTYLLISGQDVTDRKKSDAELASVNRALRLLSSSIELLIRSKNEAKLLSDVCDLIVKVGGYEMAWVGYALEDDEKSINPIAHSGASTYLNGIKLSWDEHTEIGKGPSARAIRDGQAVIIEDILKDPSFAPWVASATKHGFRSVICLPLIHENKVFGVIGMYAKDSIQTMDSEIRLLQKLADDLAFGIYNIRALDESQRFHNALYKMAASVSASIDQDFFLQLTRNMCEATMANMGFVAKLQHDNTPSLHTIAIVKDGAESPQLSMMIDSDSFAQLINKDCFVLTDVSFLNNLAAFSKLNIQSCVGHRLTSSDGTVLGVIVVMFNTANQDANFVCSLMKIFAARAGAEFNRLESERHIREQASLLDKAQDAIIVRGLDNKVQFWNFGAERLYGWTKEEALGSSIEDLLYQGNTQFQLAMEKLMENGEWNGEIVQQTKFEEKLDIESHWTLVYDDEGHAQSVFTINTNITERKAAADKIQNLAFYDPLTQLPNRTLLLDRLKHALSSCVRNHQFGALLFIDIDNFKSLNDTVGHDVGDLLLVRIGERLKTCVRATDSVARFGGDEFVIMLENLSASPIDAAFNTKTIAEKVLNTLNQPFTLGAYEHQSSASIGITLFSDQERNVSELLKHADLAMYQAKAMGRNTLRFFDPKMQLDVTSKVSLETDLRQSLIRNQLSLHYQPQVNDTGKVIGAEALLRWHHPERGMVSPAVFIPIAEETRMILSIGLWVLETACATLVKWAGQSETSKLTLAVNVSVRQFRQIDFVDQVFAILDHSGANPNKLKMELTESLFAENLDDVIEKMHRLKERGICFSLDDFGTGYSSLSYLKLMPLDQLKIDQSFVRDILEDANDATIAFSIIGLAQSLGLEVIAEGVETEAQREFLYKSGCAYFQGYLFSKPLTSELFDKFLNENKQLLINH